MIYFKVNENVGDTLSTAERKRSRETRFITTCERLCVTAVRLGPDHSRQILIPGVNGAMVSDPVSCFVACRSLKSKVWRSYQSTIQSGSPAGTLAASRGSVCLRSTASRAAPLSSSWETRSLSLLEPCTRSHTSSLLDILSSGSEDMCNALCFTPLWTKSQILNVTGHPF